MSYIVIKVYSFECDYPGCDVSNIEVVPPYGTYLNGAVRELRRSERWTVTRTGQYCAKHTRDDIAQLAAA